MSFLREFIPSLFLYVVVTACAVFEVQQFDILKETDVISFLSYEISKFLNRRRKFAKPSMPFLCRPFVYTMSHYFRRHTT